MKKYCLLILFIWLIISPISSKNELSIIPLPVKMDVGNGHFLLSSKTQLILEEASFFNEANQLQSYIKANLGYYLSEKKGANKIIIKKALKGEQADSYTLDISSREIRITAQNNQGLFYAIQTLKQVIYSQKSKETAVLPALSIYDYPSYNWRGMMLDVSRHFFSLEYLKQQIDILSYYKLNKFHLHLTDDQGWRIEIKKYPELTGKGAWRTFNNQDSLCIKQSAENPDMALDSRFVLQHNDNLYGGYYTQAELKDLIEYAKERHIEIIPEIDMPGHMMAAISAYSELSCTGDASWGELFSIPLCPCNEHVYTFLENVLDEVAALFPSKYIHIGADEVEKDTWKESLACKELMEKEGLESVDQLQSYFIERIQKYLTLKGKEMITWDEALEGGINPDVNIMYWRDWVGGVPERTVKNGNKIIFTPGTPLYFSREDSAMYDIYHLTEFKNIAKDWKSNILGIQANIWTERIPSEARANHLIYPRLFALAEMGWTLDERQNWESFKIRVKEQKEYLKENKIKFASSSSELIPQMITDTAQQAILLRFESEKAQPEIYYTTDGTQPNLNCLRYKDVISVDKSATICAAIFEEGEIQKPLFKRSLDYHKAIGKPVEYLSSWNKAYPASMESTLTDGYRGGEKYNDGYWQGFTSDMEVVIDLQEETEVTGFAATFMQLTGPGVYLPEYIEVSISNDNENYKRVLLLPGKADEENKELLFQTFEGKLNPEKARYVKVYAKNKSSDRFMFTDELIIY